MTSKPRKKRMYKNTFSPPHIVTKYLSDAMIFGGLKMGAFHWEDLPQEVKDGVHEFLAEKYPESKGAEKYRKRKNRG